MRSIQDVELPRMRHAPAGHVLYPTGSKSKCPQHLWCAYTGAERDRCPVCHATLTHGCDHQELGGRPPSSRVCLCRGCGELFSSVSAFDKHQTLDAGCHNPARRGLELVEREFQGDIWELWAFPGERPAGD